MFFNEWLTSLGQEGTVFILVSVMTGVGSTMDGISDTVSRCLKMCGLALYSEDGLTKMPSSNTLDFEYFIIFPMYFKLMMLPFPFPFLLTIVMAFYLLQPSVWFLPCLTITSTIL